MIWKMREVHRCSCVSEDLLKGKDVDVVSACSCENGEMTSGKFKSFVVIPHLFGNRFLTYVIVQTVSLAYHCIGNQKRHIQIPCIQWTKVWILSPFILWVFSPSPQHIRFESSQVQRPPHSLPPSHTIYTTQPITPTHLASNQKPSRSEQHHHPLSPSPHSPSFAAEIKNIPPKPSQSKPNNTSSIYNCTFPRLTRATSNINEKMNRKFFPHENQASCIKLRNLCSTLTRHGKRKWKDEEPGNQSSFLREKNLMGKDFFFYGQGDMGKSSVEWESLFVICRVSVLSFLLAEWYGPRSSYVDEEDSRDICLLRG